MKGYAAKHPLEVPHMRWVLTQTDRAHLVNSTYPLHAYPRFVCGGVIMQTYPGKPPASMRCKRCRRILQRAKERQ